METDVLGYLVRLKDRLYYLLVLREKEEHGEDMCFAKCASALSERMIGATKRFPQLKQQDGFNDAIDAIAFCSTEGVSLQHVRTHILNTINGIDMLITKLGG